MNKPWRFVLMPHFWLARDWLSVRSSPDVSENNSDSPFSASADSGVPGLIDQYRQQRKAWLAQADELVRLRDEVRSAAEREAMDIVTAARRDVRHIVVAARRELMVLTAQLHAAMEAVDQSSVPPTIALQDNETSSVGSEVSSAQDSLGVTRELVLGARREVRGVLDEARAEIEALASEAPIPFPTQQSAPVEPTLPRVETAVPRVETALPTIEPALPRVEPEAGRVEPELQRIELEPRRIEKLFFEEAKWAPTPQPPPVDRLMSEAEPSSIFTETSSIFSQSDEIGFSGLSRPSGGPFGVLHSNGGQPQRPRSSMVIVGAIAAAAVLFTSGTAWWLFSGDKSATREPEPAPAAVTAPPTESTPNSVPAPTVSTAPSTNESNEASLILEARRPSWIRASIDGQADAGRLYQKGEKKRIVGAQAVVIRAGDAGAVYVSVNGEQAQPLGANGAVMTRRYVIEEADAPKARPVAGPSEKRDSENRTATTAPSESPVALAVENSGRPAAARADSRSPRPVVPNPASAPAASKEPATAKDGPGARPDLVVAGQQWLDAYQRRDREAMSTAGTDNITVTDERATAERFPSWQNGVQRDLDQVELALTGDTALLTARMTERTEGGPATAQPHVSRVSQIWVRRAGQWRLADVRIIAENRLNQIVR